ncbi:MAG: VOC family protein [Litoreibacter sp.]|uniref:VOC family protein n=1 Tax=Litoreibacter sp. TaxID=1969459 RepID=UPI00329863FB
MTLLKLDHLALTSETLEAGRAHVEDALGAPLTPRGEHPLMATHNHLLSLGDEEYFEVIAVDPNGVAPNRPRWFNIDNFSGLPRLTNWIVSTQNIEAALDALPDGFGTPIAFKRGEFEWSMAVPDDGILPWGGWGPALIQWHSEMHPAPMLPDQNVRLSTVLLRHPQAVEIAAAIAPLLPRDTILFEEANTPSLSASFDTPLGPRSLS